MSAFAHLVVGMYQDSWLEDLELNLGIASGFNQTMKFLEIKTEVEK